MKAITGLFLGFLLSVTVSGQNIVATNSQFQQNPPAQQYVQTPVVAGGLYPQYVGTPVQQVVGTPVQQVYGTPVQQVVGTPVQQVVGTPVQQVVGAPVQQVPVAPQIALPPYNPYNPVNPYLNPYGFYNVLGYPSVDNTNIALNIQLLPRPSVIGGLPSPAVLPQVPAFAPQYSFYPPAQTPAFYNNVPYPFFNPYAVPPQFPLYSTGAVPQFQQVQVSPAVAPVPSLSPVPAVSPFSPVPQVVPPNAGPVYYR